MDERQFNYLQEMDIPLWISRDAHQIDEHQETQSEVQPQTETLQSPQHHQIVETQSVEPPKDVQQPLAEITPEPPPEPDAITEQPLDWSALQSVVSQCQHCSELLSNRSQTVFGVGNPQADWLIIGEAPGAEEDRQGEPFVGRAGQLLNAMLQAIGLKRSQVYITNILKCHPPNNRDPKPEEIEKCGAYLQRQIELIQPKLILVAGGVAAQTLLKSNEPVGQLRGKVHLLESPESPELKIPLIVTYHPAYLLRAPAEKAKAWSDLKLARNVFNR